MNSLPRFAGNVAVGIALVLVVGLLFGGVPSACGAATWLRPWLLSLGICMVVGGFVVWAFSVFKNTQALLVTLAGLIVADLPQLVLLFAEVRC